VAAYSVAESLGLREPPNSVLHPASAACLQHQVVKFESGARG